MLTRYRRPSSRPELYLATILSCTVLALAGCFPAPRAHSSRPAAPRAQPKQVDAKAQQVHYDTGLKQYSQENYRAAREAFQQSVDAGPNTPLAAKAMENIRKIDRILKTLEEIESK